MPIPLRRSGSARRGPSLGPRAKRDRPVAPHSEQRGTHILLPPFSVPPPSRGFARAGRLPRQAGAARVDFFFTRRRYSSRRETRRDAARPVLQEPHLPFPLPTLCRSRDRGPVSRAVGTKCQQRRNGLTRGLPTSDWVGEGSAGLQKVVNFPRVIIRASERVSDLALSRPSRASSLVVSLYSFFPCACLYGAR